MVVVERGTKITCPLCKAIVGEVIKDLRSGDVLGKNTIRDYRGMWKHGEPLVCTECGFPIAVKTNIGHVLHTEKGWMPYGVPTSFLVYGICEYLKEHGMWRKEWDKLLQQL